MVWDVLGGVAVVILVLAVAFLIRLRRLAGRVGAFELALRRTGQRGWASGIGIFGDDDVEWYRLVSLGWRPRLRFHRPDIELGELRHRGSNGRIVDVELDCAGRHYDLAMLEDSHSALVAWLESAAPHQPTLF